jgi:hypothetical protein
MPKSEVGNVGREKTYQRVEIFGENEMRYMLCKGRKHEGTEGLSSKFYFSRAVKSDPDLVERMEKETVGLSNEGAHKF